MRFIGRGRTRRRPAGHGASGALSGSAGSVLDPIVAIRYAITLDPDRTGTHRSGHRHRRQPRGRRWRLVEKYQDRASPIASSIWPGPTVRWCCARSTPPRPMRNSTGDSPVPSSTPMPRCAPSRACSARIGAGNPGFGATASPAMCRSCCCGSAIRANIELVRQLVQAHAYWRLKGLAVDLVIWNEDRAGYRQVLHDQILGLIAAGAEAQCWIGPAASSSDRADQIPTRIASCSRRWRGSSSATPAARWRNRSSGVVRWNACHVCG